MVTVRDFLKYQTRLHSIAIRNLKDKANSASCGYMKPTLPEWKSYIAHKKQCSLALAALWVDKTENGNPSLSKNINGSQTIYGVTLDEARKHIEHIRTNVLYRKGLAERLGMINESLREKLTYDVRPIKSLEEVWNSMQKDDAYELSPGLVEIPLRTIQKDAK